MHGQVGSAAMHAWPCLMDPKVILGDRSGRVVSG